jgi:hypothetical protein
MGTVKLLLLLHPLSGIGRLSPQAEGFVTCAAVVRVRNRTAAPRPEIFRKVRDLWEV